MDVGGLPNHVKYCVSVLYLLWANISTSPVGIPNNWYQSIWFKVVFDFCSKIKIVKIVFWPYHCLEEEKTSTLVKTAQKSDFEHSRHTPARWLLTRTDACHVSSSPRWADPTWIPDDPTHVADMDGGWHHYNISITSACIMGMPCQQPQLTRQHNGTHLTRHQPRAEGKDSV